MDFLMLMTRVYKIRLDLNNFQVGCENNHINYKQNDTLYNLVQCGLKYNNLDSLESIQKRIDATNIYPGVVFYVSL